MTVNPDGLGPVDFPTLGWQVVEWIEANLVHGPGDVQGQPIVLDDELTRFLCHAYRVDPDTGRRAFRRCCLSRPKGRAKSEFAAMVVCAEALGPVRFDRFDGQGDPVGRAVRAPFIRCLATEETQAGFVYESVLVMLACLRDEHGADLDIGLTRTYLPGGGEIRPSTASSSAKDGGKETFTAADETHLYVLPELKRMHAVVRRNLAKRRDAEPWMLDVTTAFLPGEESIAEELHQHAAKAMPGQLEAEGILYDYRAAPPIADWHDDAEILAALRAVYGPAAGWMDLRRLLAEIRDPHADPADSARYWLNQLVASSDQWLPAQAWALCARPGEQVEAGDRIAVGFDGSRFDDSTALVGCRLSDGHLFMVGLWEKPDGRAGDGWEVPREEVDAAMHAAMSEHAVVRCYADPPFWQAEVDAWAREWPEAVVAWWTQRDAQMSRALERFHTDAIAGVLTHDGDPALARHVANARKRKTRAGVGIRKDRQRSPHKIDAAVAAVLAYEARADALAAGLDKPKRSNRLHVF